MKNNIGVTAKPPENACEDKNCAWHGNLKVRGRVFRGTVKSAKTHNTAIIEWKFSKYVPKYERYERRHSRVIAHNPPCIHAKDDELVIVAECRPLSKTKKFIIIEKLGSGEIEIKGEDLIVKEKDEKVESSKTK
ncbi:MAG: 30S ribosomal protein S17 [Candidatus Aenigmarchaeota archaeon]|nr:30S ribosomal protein S17 [Candidatus Aenigmarchaeota archaeon]